MARAHPALARDREYMARALRLAARAAGQTSPNPLVGAVVVSGGRVIGEGYHRHPGGPHAEILALKRVGRRARGTTLYLTLEPCCHTNKRTPPCVPALIEAGLRRVVVAMADPNAVVSGRGIRALKRAGIRVDVGCLATEAAALNRAYVHTMRTGLPWVLLKAGMSLDGQIATASGESRWITGEAARADAQKLRAKVDAVVVGIGTVLRDDPQLTARVGARVLARQPLRVVLDTRLRIPLTARVLHAKAGRCLIMTSRAPRRKIAQLRAMGIEVVPQPAGRGGLSVTACMRSLAARGIQTVMLEGGSELNAAALSEGLVREVRLYVAPRLIGGRDAIGLLGSTAPALLKGATMLDDVTIRRIGEDFIFSGMVSQFK
ncbi:MAG TPA: bifunctional diaminohydroxyphosphoribosylaminopyrimidine deaminase/5-amino-6-(5-phosphoribosylamino)uracil reductase RibD [Nitrospirales bacterium]|nr:bifunctional diaminohydroxyphosphoribosylaminopyrimidine deaminase/5-amino-6-(5-phosphoribosylamino)uracil reductase RibD [Nitrospirales bacterium]